MSTTLEAFGWIGVVIGASALLGAPVEISVEDAVFAFLGGGFFLSWGICTLVYLKK